MCKCHFCNAEATQVSIDVGPVDLCDKCATENSDACAGCGGLMVWTVTSSGGLDGRVRCQSCDGEYCETEPSPWVEPEKHKAWREKQQESWNALKREGKLYSNPPQLAE